MNVYNFFSAGIIDVFEEQRTYIAPTPIISCNFERFKNLKVTSPSGTHILKETPKRPFMMIFLPGMKIELTTGPTRETRTVFFHTNDFELNDTDKTIEINYYSECLKIPCWIYVEETDNDYIRHLFRQIDINSKKALAYNKFLCETYFMDLLKYFINSKLKMSHESEEANPETRLKKFIDEDTTFKRKISDFSRNCKMDKDHLRLLFKNKYTFSPKQYQEKLRSAKMFDLVVNSSLIVKEIAAETGFKHSAHFCSKFLKEFKITPKEAIEKYRFKK